MAIAAGKDFRGRWDKQAFFREGRDGDEQVAPLCPAHISWAGLEAALPVSSSTGSSCPQAVWNPSAQRNAKPRDEEA